MYMYIYIIESMTVSSGLDEWAALLQHGDGLSSF